MSSAAPQSCPLSYGYGGGTIIYTDGAGAVSNTPLPVLNVDLLTEAVSWARYSALAEPELLNKLGTAWYQGSWFRDNDNEDHVAASHHDHDEHQEQLNPHQCKTSFCIAGYTTMAAGYSARRQVCNYCGNFLGDSNECCGEETIAEYGTHWTTGMIGLNKIHPSMPAYFVSSGYADAAETLLGLTSYEAHRLFDGDNTIENVIEIAQDIAASRGEVLDLDVWEFHEIGEEHVNNHEVRLHHGARRAEPVGLWDPVITTEFDQQQVAQS